MISSLTDSADSQMAVEGSFDPNKQGDPQHHDNPDDCAHSNDDKTSPPTPEEHLEVEGEQLPASPTFTFGEITPGARILLSIEISHTYVFFRLTGVHAEARIYCSQFGQKYWTTHILAVRISTACPFATRVSKSRISAIRIRPSCLSTI